MGIKTGVLRLISTQRNENRVPMVLGGSGFIFQFEDISKILKDTSNIIIDMKGEVEISKDDKGDFEIISIASDFKGDVVVGSFGLKYKTDSENTPLTYLEIAYPFCKKNRELVEMLALGNHINLNVELTQVPESECTPNPEDMVQPSKVEEAKEAEEEK